MNRDGRPLHLLVTLGVGLVITVALVGIDRWFVKPRPTEQAHPDPAQEWEVSPLDDTANRPSVPQWAKCATLAAWLHAHDPDLRVVHPPGAAFCYVIEADVDPATLDELLPSEDYADCWRGAVECVADAPPAYGVGPHACGAGDCWLFGDVELLDKVRPVAEQVHFGPYRGIGGPKTPRP
jgi:hypothetical protein